MTIKMWTGYSGICDWPGCAVDVMDGTDYSAWGEREAVEETMQDSDWWIDADGDHHYCNDHPAAWASEPDYVETLQPPFLLIHDGDTGNPADDGRVTLIGTDS